LIIGDINQRQTASVKKLTPFRLKFFAVTTIAEREHQAIKLADHTQQGTLLEANDDFCLAISYNPGYQSVLKDLKQSTRQRFVALEFNYPAAELERKIVSNESGVALDIAEKLVKFAQMTRNLKGSGLEEGASTRLLVHAAKLMASHIEPVTACQSAIAQALTDDEEMLAAVQELSSSLF
ncbi:MAG: CbbQ/NirQ/NorQ C-terminal domain-containing protein, partial [Sulfurimicrobium sp.]|nr:CbbQ/NirQ/NorQ C-terminal domain-containing protein [Sulfurimicrobium sp.]